MRALVAVGDGLPLCVRACVWSTFTSGCIGAT